MCLKLRFIALIIAGLSVMVGCSSTHPNVVEMGKVKHIQIDQMQKARKNGFLVVKAAIKNTSKYNQMINYRFQWLDDQGFPVSNEEVWKTKLIYGKQSTFVSSTAPVSDAVDFRVEIQKP